MIVVTIARKTETESFGVAESREIVDNFKVQRPIVWPPTDLLVKT